MLAILKTNNEEVRLDREDAVPLDEVQQLVGGYVEIVPGFNKYLDQDCVALCDEDGKLKGLPYNEQATKAWQHCLDSAGSDILVGDIVVLISGAMKGWK